MSSTVKSDKIQGATGTTVTVPSGHNLVATDALKADTIQASSDDVLTIPSSLNVTGYSANVSGNVSVARSLAVGYTDGRTPQANLDVSGNTYVSGASTLTGGAIISGQQMPDEGALTDRNAIINGNFDIWQRATSYTDVAGIWNYGFADRWSTHNDGADAGTFTRSTTVPNTGSTYSLLMTGATSVTNTNMLQKVESHNLQAIRQADSYTISCWMRSATAAKAINVNCLLPNALDNYSGYNQTAGSTSTTISGNGTSSAAAWTLTDADTWYYCTATHNNYDSLTNNANGWALFLAVVSQTSASHQVYLSQVQVEPGLVATPYQFQKPAEVLQQCQRYYQKSYAVGTDPGTSVGSYLQAKVDNSTYNFIKINFSPIFRATPTIVTYSTTGASGKLRNLSAGTDIDETVAGYAEGIIVHNASAVTSGQNIAFHYTADAEI